EAAAPESKWNLTEESVQLAATLTQGVLDRMEMSSNCSSRLIEPRDADDNPSIWVDIQGRDASRLLAHQSEALDALQLVVQTMWAHQTKSNLRLTLDADSYKERRTQHLQQMAQRLAERVVSSGRAITLEPMSAAERRLVHIALRDHPQVMTESHGEGSARRLTIRLK
ncbi:MAG TPA: R3H domain-containing nucleic acid-binding protein, partial [Anaerolineae bacterium]